MAINVSIRYNGGLLPDILLLTQCYYHHRRTCLNVMKRFCLSLQHMFPPKRFDFSPPDWGMLRRSRRVQIFLQTITTKLVALTGSEHGTQIYPLASYFLVV